MFPKLQKCKSVELGDQIICWFCGTCEDDIAENIPRLSGYEEILKRFIAHVCVGKTGLPYIFRTDDGLPPRNTAMMARGSKRAFRKRTISCVELGCGQGGQLSVF